jgi:hypothetical protein
MLHLARTNQLGTYSNPTTLVISASVTTFPNRIPAALGLVEHLTFEPVSQIRRLETPAFVAWTSLKSICIPASVQFIAAYCFSRSDDGLRPVDPPCQLETVTFEPGSKLHGIDKFALHKCEALKYFYIPASVELLYSHSFPHTRHCRIEIENGNPHFEMKGDFLIRLNSHSLVRYCGTASKVTILDEIEKLEAYCFGDCDSVVFVTGRPISKMSVIEEQAFLLCPNLKTITIPPSATFIGSRCFNGCSSLQTVVFSPPSQLESLLASSFGGCCSLESIVLPPSLKVLPISCFSDCRKLVRSPFPPDSNIVRIERSAFAGCSALKSMSLPSSLESVDRFCFEDCTSLATVTFESPSHLRELLDLPPKLAGCLSVPDSVEVLYLARGLKLFKRGFARAFLFGRDSRLTETIPRSQLYQAGKARREKKAKFTDSYPTFLQLAVRTLKAFRSDLEFGA